MDAWMIWAAVAEGARLGSALRMRSHLVFSPRVDVVGASDRDVRRSRRSRRRQGDGRPWQLPTA